MAEEEEYEPLDLSMEYTAKHQTKALAKRIYQNKREVIPSSQRSYFGKQVDSTKLSRPAIGFGTAERFGRKGEPGSRQYISKEHVKHMPFLIKTPGPIYDLPGSCGEQTHSWKRTIPSTYFGSAYRFADDLRLERAKGKMPGPDIYTLEAASGRQTNSNKATETRVIFGRESRDSRHSVGKGYEEALYGRGSPGPAMYQQSSAIGRQGHAGRSSGNTIVFGTEPISSDPNYMNVDEKRAERIPGPGQYYLNGSCGPQCDSGKPSRPIYGVGTATRDQAAASSLTPAGAMAVLGGRDSPGAGTYPAAMGALGRNPRSDKKNSSFTLFGTRGRFSGLRSTGAQTPGPGSYCV